MASKRFMGILLTLAMVFSMAACSKKAEETTKKKTKKTTEPEETTVEPDDTEDETTTEKTTQETTKAASGIIDADASLNSTSVTPGTIQIIPESCDGINGLYLASPHSGSEGMNAACYRTSLIRFIFDNSDHIEIYPSFGFTSNAGAYLIPHHEDASIYTEDYIKALPDEVARTQLTAPDTDDWYWGDVTLVKDFYDPGYYDLVFVDAGQPLFYVCLKIVETDGLSDVEDYSYYEMFKKEIDMTGGQDLYKIDFDKFYGCYEQGIWPDEYTWSGSGLPTIPADSDTATIELQNNDSYVRIASPLTTLDEESVCVQIDEVFQNNGYELDYPDGDADANYRYVRTDIDGVPVLLSYYGYNGELIFTIENLIANSNY